MARPLFKVGFCARRLVQAPSTSRSFFLSVSVNSIPFTRPCLFQPQFRHFKAFSNTPPKSTPPPPPLAPGPGPGPPPSLEPTLAQQRKSDWAIIKRLLENVWPRGDWKTRGTVLFSFGLLVGSKVCQYFTAWNKRYSCLLGRLAFECPSSVIVQRRRGFVERRYHGAVDGMGARRESDTRMYVVALRNLPIALTSYLQTAPLALALPCSANFSTLSLLTSANERYVALRGRRFNISSI